MIVLNINTADNNFTTVEAKRNGSYGIAAGVCEGFPIKLIIKATLNTWVNKMSKHDLLVKWKKEFDVLRKYFGEDELLEEVEAMADVLREDAEREAIEVSEDVYPVTHNGMPIKLYYYK